VPLLSKSCGLPVRSAIVLFKFARGTPELGRTAVVETNIKMPVATRIALIALAELEDLVVEHHV
jgi:hypothetical protein